MGCKRSKPSQEGDPGSQKFIDKGQPGVRDEGKDRSGKFAQYRSKLLKHARRGVGRRASWIGGRAVGWCWLVDRWRFLLGGKGWREGGRGDGEGVGVGGRVVGVGGRGLGFGGSAGREGVMDIRSEVGPGFIDLITN